MYIFVVDVLNVKAVFRKVSDRDDCFQPAVTRLVTCRFLSLNEGNTIETEQ